MVEDKISGVGAGAAAAASDFRDAKSGLASSGLDGPESLKEPELGIPDDGDIEKVERVYRYVLSQLRNVVCEFWSRVWSLGRWMGDEKLIMEQENRSKDYTA